MNKRTTVGAALLAIAAAPSLAASDADSKLLEILRARGSISEAEYQELKGLYGEEAKKAGASDVTVSTKGGLSVETADGRNSFDLIGRLFVDAAAISNDEADLDPGSGTEFRAGRLGAEGTIAGDYEYKAEFDFAGNETEIKDLYIGYAPWNVKVGQHKMPFSLEELTSSRFITFMERGLPNEFATSRRIGASWTLHDPEAFPLHFTVAGYGQEEGGDEDEEGFGAGARLAWAPINAGGNMKGAGSLGAGPTVLHFGIAGAWENTPDTDSGDFDDFRIRQRPEVHITERLVDTGAIVGADDLMKWGAEAAAVFGPFSAQAEYMRLDLDGQDMDGVPGRDELEFDGWYAFVSWFLTGESRTYKAEKAAFDRVKPAHPVGSGGMGAWELAVRRSNIDLTDGDFDGGEMNNWTVGLNWYLTDFMRVMFNYVDVDADRPGGLNDQPRIFMTRFQIDWK
jgi:phosphate-selective porin OprO and OprP